MAEVQDNKAYDFKQAEEKIRTFWEKEEVFKFKKAKKIYSIDTPPPTISGKMHIGHAFSYSQQDFIARFRRMCEGSVFYPFGTDDNGLPTEKLVEKINNIRSKNMSRADFIALCLKTLKEITPTFIQDWKNIGISCDYSKSYSTIDQSSRKMSQKAFLDLYKKGEIYKKEFPSLWCPDCQTAIAQAELEDKELPSLFSTLKFSVDGKDLLIATTRPELLPACVAVFVNPEDKRYKKIVGKKAKVPLFNSEVPIIADKSAEIDKGTGVLMICSYGDKFDAEAINRHKLTPKVIITPDGKINSGKYTGLKIKATRKQILEDLKEAGMVSEQKQITHIVNVHDKCGTEIEFLPTTQWFIKILDKKQKLIDQGKKIIWHPDFMFKRYENWVSGLEWDWNISRDRHFGIPLPVWQCEKCNQIILPEEKELPIDPLQTEKTCPKCKSKAIGESKVLDTWATSSISPQIAAASSKEITLPYSLRPQAHDIIRTWAFYTIARSLLHENSIPWKDIMISGFVTLSGEKMSKSKGNVIDPHTILEKYGADSLRFWAAGSKLGEDLDYQEQDLISGKKTITKLWNASKFVFMNLNDYSGKKPTKLEEVDKQFLSQLNDVVIESTKAFENYEYSKAKSETEKFFWQNFCDNYLEVVKSRIYNEKGDKKLSAQYTLYHSLLTILKLFAPIMPFITEEIFQTFFKKEKDKSIHTSSWPKQEKTQKSDKLNKLYEIIAKVRQEKTNAKKSMKAEIILTLEKSDKEKLKGMLDDLRAVTTAKDIKEGSFKVEFLS